VSYRLPAETRSFAFGGPEGDLFGAATVWDGGFCSSFGAPTAVEGSEPDEEWRLAGEGFELTFAPVGEAAELELADAGITARYQLARVHGTMMADGNERALDCAGELGTRVGALDSKRFDTVRAISAWFGEQNGFALLAARPRRARGHDADIVAGVLFESGVPVPISESRISTTFTAGGSLARVGLELWLGEDDGDDADQYARRAAAEATGLAAVCGDPPLRAELLRWHMQGRAGLGVHDLVRAR
jgi:hypothetical protein